MNGEHLWLSAIENCVYAKKPGAKFKEHCKSPVWRFATEGGVPHPTPKPVPLMEYLIRTSSDTGDTVFDPCMGGGASGVAAIRLGRRFIGCELEPKYFALSQKRIEVERHQTELFEPISQSRIEGA